MSKTARNFLCAIDIYTFFYMDGTVAPRSINPNFPMSYSSAAITNQFRMSIRGMILTIILFGTLLLLSNFYIFWLLCIPVNISFKEIKELKDII